MNTTANLHFMDGISELAYYQEVTENGTYNENTYISRLTDLYNVSLDTAKEILQHLEWSAYGCKEN